MDNRNIFLVKKSTNEKHQVSFTELEDNHIFSNENDYAILIQDISDETQQTVISPKSDNIEKFESWPRRPGTYLMLNQKIFDLIYVLFQGKEIINIDITRICFNNTLNITPVFNGNYHQFENNRPIFCGFESVIKNIKPP